MRSVLLVEDDTRLAMATTRTLRVMGYEVVVAFDVGLDVLDAVERRADLDAAVDAHATQTSTIQY